MLMLIVPGKSSSKVTVHLPMPLQLSVLLSIDGAKSNLLITHFYHLKLHWPVIKQLIATVEEDMSAELQIMLKCMVLLSKTAIHFLTRSILLNNANKKHQNARNSKSQIIVSHLTNKISNNKSSTMGQFFQSFQSIEIS